MDAKYVKCAAKCCGNKLIDRSDLTFFTFPEDDKLAKIWASNSDVSFYYYGSTLCAEHFEDKYFDSNFAKKSVFKQDVKPIPTIFNINVEKVIKTPENLYVSFDELSANLDFGNLTSYSDDFLQNASVEHVENSIYVPDNNTETVNLEKNDFLQTTNIKKADTAPDDLVRTIKIEKNLDDSENRDLQPNKISVQYCRLCANLLPVSKLRSIYGEPNYSNMLEMCLPGKFLKTDEISQKICSTCISKLENCSTILKSFMAADKKLRNIQSNSHLNKPSTSHQSAAVLNSFDDIEILNENDIIIQEKNRMKFQCIMCSSLFNSQEKIILHAFHAHPTTRKSKIISKIVQTNAGKESDQIKPKTNLQSTVQKYQCLTCMTILDTKEDVISHTRVKHNFSSHNKLLTKIINVKMNQITKKQRKYMCVSCPTIFKSRKEVIYHASITHPQNKIISKTVMITRNNNKGTTSSNNVLVTHPKNKIVSKPVFIKNNNSVINNKGNTSSYTSLPNISSLLNTSDKDTQVVNQTLLNNRNIFINNNKVKSYTNNSHSQKLMHHKKLFKYPEYLNNMNMIPKVFNTNVNTEKRSYRKYTKNENPGPIISYQIKYQCQVCSVLFNNYKEILDHNDHLHSTILKEINTLASIVKVKETNKVLTNDEQNSDDKENTTVDSLENDEDSTNKIICINDGTIIEIDPNIKHETRKRKPYPAKIVMVTKYKCLKCSKLFNGKKLLIQHALCAHPAVGVNEINCKIIKKKKELNPSYYSTRARYECLICGSHHVASHGLVKHTQFLHPSIGANKFLCRYITSQNIQSKQCLHCNATLANYSRYRQHMQKHVSFRCEECEARFFNMNDLRDHVKKHNEPESSKKSYKCMGCDKEFSGRIQLYVHEQIHKIPKDVSCPKCNKHFPSEFELQRHERTHEICLCDVCGKTYEITYIKDHLQTHNEGTPFKCKLCIRSFKTKGALAKHKKQHFPNSKKTTMCQVCGKIIRNESLNLHMRIHTGERPEVCEICGAAFRRKDHLRNHKKTHTHSISYQCPLCTIYLSSKSYRKHMITAHSDNFSESIQKFDKRFNCVICAKQFKSRTYLEDHYRMHAGQKIYSCDVCGKSFGTKIVLHQHKRTHLDYDQLPYQCDICHKKFRRQENLRNHRRVHTGEKPFPCPICQRPFRVRGEMVKHMRIHKRKDERKINKSLSESSNNTTNNSENDYYVDDSNSLDGITNNDMPCLD